MLGYYFSQGETPEPTRISMADVAKFAHVPGLKAVYHHGPVTIYNTAGLGVVPEREGYRGHHAMGLGPLDAVVGAAVVLLLWLIRRRLAWVKAAARDIGVLGATLAVMAISIFLGGALFALRLMPGPAFTVGAVAASLVILAVQRRSVLIPAVQDRMDSLRLGPRLPSPHSLDPRRFVHRLNPLVVLGLVAGMAGLAIAIHAAWITDVADVHAILRAVT
jgi:hypothetical protein